MQRPLLQVISTSPWDSRTIQEYGADRIELVSALQIGGLSPSAGLLRRSLEVAAIPTMVMVRHHNQGFIHSLEQKQLLVQEAVSLVESGAKGLVIGSITPDSQVDTQFLDLFSKEVNTHKIDVTFHKAADQTRDLQTAYQTLQKYGIKRVLTQGGSASLLDNTDTLQKVLQIKEVTTLLGGGITHSNIQQILHSLPAQQIHIGTCVRLNRFGRVQDEALGAFVSLLNCV